MRRLLIDEKRFVLSVLIAKLMTSDRWPFRRARLAAIDPKVARGREIRRCRGIGRRLKGSFLGCAQRDGSVSRYYLVWMDSWRLGKKEEKA
jgi:hypothetical protein